MMGRKERLEALEKFENIKIEEEKKTVTEKPQGFKKKTENFFYHYKVHVIAGIFILVLAVIFIRDLVTRPNYDFTVLMAGGVYVSAENEELLTKRMQAYGVDVNGDGQVLISFSPIYLIDATDNAEYAEQMMASQMKFVAEVSTGDSYIYVMDQAVFDSMFGEDPDTFSEIEYLDGTAFASGTVLELDKELVICLRSRDSVNLSKEKNQQIYDASETLFYNIIGDRVD